MQAQHAALLSGENIYGPTRHKDNSAHPVDDLAAAHASVRAVWATGGTPVDATRPPSELTSEFAMRTTPSMTGRQGPFVRWRETAASMAGNFNNFDMEGRFYTDAKQRGPGAKMPPIHKELAADEAQELRYRDELVWRAVQCDPCGPPHHTLLRARPALSKGRKVGAETNESKAERLREQIRTIWQQLPPHLLNATQIHQRLIGFSVDVRTVRRHLLALKLTKP